MRKEIDFGQGRTLVFEDCGPNQFVISMLADYQVQEGEGARDRLTGRAIKYSTCLTGFHMVDVLKEAVTEWYKGNEENKLPPPVTATPGGKAENAPVPMLLTCPMCTKRHVDEGEFAKKGHHTHACQSCGHTWRPALVETVGVMFLPGFKNPPVVDLRGLNEPSTKDRLHDLEKKVAELEKRPIGNLVMAFPPAIGVLGDYPTMTVDGPMTDEMIAAYKKSVKKEPKWYRVTFKGDQVYSAVSVSASRPECRDFEDETHCCIRQAGSLREAVKVSEFERQFGGCKKSTAK